MMAMAPRRTHVSDHRPNAPASTPGDVDRKAPPEAPRRPEHDEEHEGGTEQQVGDLTGPGAGYDDEPEKVRDRGGVA
jgi:hypothetical protein